MNTEPADEVDEGYAAFLRFLETPSPPPGANAPRSLSPSAAPFRPAPPEPGLEFAIFNDGVPSSVYHGARPEIEIVQQIPDEAIEELFPPSAGEAAELDAADEHVETMAWLAYLDERDERARLHFTDCQKRWATRRKDGLVGKPRPPKAHHQADDEVDVGVASADGGTESLVSYRPHAFEVRPRKVEQRMYAPRVPKNARAAHGRRDRYTFSATTRQYY